MKDESLSVMSDSAIPWTSPCLRSHGILQARILEKGSLSLLQGIFPTQGSNTGLQHCSDSLRAQPQGKPKNTEVGSLSFLQRIFMTQESKPGLLHCKKIVYQLRYQGSWYVYVCYQLVRLGDLRELILQSGGWLDAVSWDSVVTYIAHLPIC